MRVPAEPGPPVSCMNCAGYFVRTDRRQKYCTKQCKTRQIRRAWARRNRTHVVGRSAQCAHCKTDFVAMRKDKRYCSEACCGIASATRWAEANPDGARRNKAKYNSTHPEVLLANKHRRRAREKNAPGHWTAGDLKKLKAILGASCLADSDHQGPLTWDHVVPLARGGDNHPTNLQPLCRRCNSRKGAFRHDDYRADAQMKAIREIFGTANH